MNAFQEMMNLQERIEASAGWQISNKRRILGISYFILMRNCGELKKILDDFQKPAVAITIWDVRNRDELDQFQNEVLRLFHNYLAAAKSLVDHTRIFVQETYNAHDFLEEYNAKKKQEFDDSSFVHFVQDLRNYTLHKGLPFTIATLAWERDFDIDSSIMLDVTELRKWDRWSRMGQQHLDTLGDEVKLFDVVHTYESIVAAFYDWLEDRQFEIHQNEFEELQDLLDGVKKFKEKTRL